MKKLFAFIALSLLAAIAGAQQLQVSTGAAKGSTYTDMFAAMGKYCGTQIALVPVPSSGSVENLDRLVGNAVNAAFVQSDMLSLRGMTEDLGNIKTLLALHPETVHFVAPQRSGLKSGGVMGVGGQEVVIQDIGQLAGLRVGAAGGSVVTAKVVKLQSDIGYTLTEYPDTAAVLKALAAGEINAAVLVGGAPLGSVASLPEGYKLLAVPPAVVEKLKNVYRPIRANYRNLGAAGVSTVSTDALLVARAYKTAKMVEALGAFRQCVLANLDEIKETTGTHPAWQGVRADNRGMWPYYELPATPAKR